jgi:hypothetical protein
MIDWKDVTEELPQEHGDVIVMLFDNNLQCTSPTVVYFAEDKSFEFKKFECFEIVDHNGKFEPVYYYFHQQNNFRFIGGISEKEEYKITHWAYINEPENNNTENN